VAVAKKVAALPTRKQHDAVAKPQQKLASVKASSAAQRSSMAKKVAARLGRKHGHSTVLAQESAKGHAHVKTEGKVKTEASAVAPQALVATKALVANDVGANDTNDDNTDAELQQVNKLEHSLQDEDAAIKAVGPDPDDDSSDDVDVIDSSTPVENNPTPPASAMPAPKHAPKVAMTAKAVVAPKLKVQAHAVPKAVQKKSAAPAVIKPALRGSTKSPDADVNDDVEVLAEDVAAGDVAAEAKADAAADTTEAADKVEVSKAEVKADTAIDTTDAADKVDVSKADVKTAAMADGQVLFSSADVKSDAGDSQKTSTDLDTDGTQIEAEEEQLQEEDKKINDIDEDTDVVDVATAGAPPTKKATQKAAVPAKAALQEIHSDITHAKLVVDSVQSGQATGPDADDTADLSMDVASFSKEVAEIDDDKPAAKDAADTTAAADAPAKDVAQITATDAKLEDEDIQISKLDEEEDNSADTSEATSVAAKENEPSPEAAIADEADGESNEASASKETLGLADALGSKTQKDAEFLVQLERRNPEMKEADGSGPEA